MKKSTQNLVLALALFSSTLLGAILFLNYADGFNATNVPQSVKVAGAIYAICAFLAWTYGLNRLLTARRQRKSGE